MPDDILYCTKNRGIVNITQKTVWRFWSYIDKDGPSSKYAPGKCWVWTASRDQSGHGQISIKNRPERAHRISFLIANSSMDRDLNVNHKCHNPSCCNPSHLYQGTQAQNMKDMASSGRSASRNGYKHPSGDSAARAVLSNKQVVQIREEYKPGAGAAIGKRYGISKSAVIRIAYGETYPAAGGPIFSPPKKRRLSSEEVIEIRRRLSDGETRKSLADAFKLDYFCVRSIAVGRRWKGLIDINS